MITSVLRKLMIVSNYATTPMVVTPVVATTVMCSPTMVSIAQVIDVGKFTATQ